MIAHRDPSRAERHRRRGIALRRFGENIFFRQVGQQLPHRSFLIDVCQNEEALARDESLKSRDRLLKQRLFRDQPQELLRTRAPAQRPETLATSPGEDQRVDRIGHDKLRAKQRRLPDHAGGKIFPFPFLKRDV